MSLEVSVAVNVAIQKLDLQTFITANMHLCSCRFTSALIVLGYFCACKKGSSFTEVDLFPPPAPLFSFLLCVVVVVVEALLPSEEQTPNPICFVLLSFSSCVCLFFYACLDRCFRCLSVCLSLCMS